MPETVDDFRSQVPFTTYADYCPELHERLEHGLPAKPAYWVRTSGYSGTYDIKWVPWSEGFAAECEKVCGACAIFSQARHHGDLARMKPHLKILYTVAGLEYASGALGHLMQRAIDFDYLPSSTDGMTFVESIKAGFAQALYQGLDGFGGLPSVLVTVGEPQREQNEVSWYPSLSRKARRPRRSGCRPVTHERARRLRFGEQWTLGAVAGRKGVPQRSSAAHPSRPVKELRWGTQNRRDLGRRGGKPRA